MINKWQIDMERSLRFNTLFFYRTPTLLFLLLLFPVLVQATESVYEQQIQQARNGNYTPFLDYLQRYQQQHALTPEHVADWLQVAPGQVMMTRLFRSGSATAFICRCPPAALLLSRRPDEIRKRGSPLWRSGKKRAALRRITTIIVSAISKPWPMPVKIRLPFRRPDGWWRRPSQAHLQTLAYVWLRQGKAGIGF
jgi:biofilm PGA synthesis protein PgaA